MIAGGQLTSLRVSGWAAWGSGRFLLGQADADQARQMNAEEGAARLEFIGEFNAALATPHHLYQVDPEHPKSG
jgi:hypothetical protein